MRAFAQADSLDVALEIINSNTHGNGTAIFTRSGPAARKFQDEVQVLTPSPCKTRSRLASHSRDEAMLSIQLGLPMPMH